MFAGRFKPGTYELTLDAEHVVGDIAYIAWRASCATDEVMLGADTFVVRDGKIAAQTYTAKVKPKSYERFTETEQNRGRSGGQVLRYG